MHRYFDKIVDSILKESVDSIIPVLDGNREIYALHIFSESLTTGGLNRRESYAHFISYWNEAPIECTVDYKTALTETIKWYQAQAIDAIDIESTNANLNYIENQINRLKDIHGTWKIIGDIQLYTNYPSNSSDTFTIGIEVDTNYYINNCRHDSPFKDFDF